MGKYKFFQDTKGKKKGEKAKDIKAGFKGTTSAEEAMKMSEEAQDRAREKEEKKKNKGYFGKLKKYMSGK